MSEPLNDNRILMKFNAARQALAVATRIDEVKKVRDQAEALRLYVKQQKGSLVMQNQCAEIKLRSERRAGELIAVKVKHEGGRPGKLSHDTTVSLKGLGVSRDQSSRWQQIAAMPEEQFEGHLAETQAAGDELTTAGVLEKIKAEKREQKEREREAKRQTDTEQATGEPAKTDRVTLHKLIVGDAMSMAEIADDSIHLIVTSPPYFDAPFDSRGSFGSYGRFLAMLRGVAAEAYRVLQAGRIAVVSIDDMRVDGELFPLVADATRIFGEAGFRYRDRLFWKKPDGYVRISRRSGVLVEHPYPMYFYPDNVVESLLIFQKGTFDYRSIPQAVREASSIDIQRVLDERWYLTLWEMTNVLPNAPLEKGIAAFPDELPYRVITLFSHVGETVLDPFLGSGTTMKVARHLGRHSIGIEINASHLPIIRRKVGFNGGAVSDMGDQFKVVVRDKTLIRPVPKGLAR